MPAKLRLTPDKLECQRLLCRLLAGHKIAFWGIHFPRRLQRIFRIILEIGCFSTTSNIVVVFCVLHSSGSIVLSNLHCDVRNHPHSRLTPLSDSPDAPWFHPPSTSARWRPTLRCRQSVRLARCWRRFDRSVGSLRTLSCPQPVRYREHSPL